jgi:WD40 repeat protein
MSPVVLLWVITAGAGPVVEQTAQSAARPELILPSNSTVQVQVRSNSDGRWFVSAGLGNRFLIHDGQTGAVLRTLGTGTATIAAVAITPDDRTIVAADQSGDIQLWDAVSGRLQRRARGPLRPRALAVAPDGSRIAVLGDQALQVLARDSLDVIRQVPIPPGTWPSEMDFTLLQFFLGGRAVAFAPPDGTVRRLDVETGAERTLFSRAKGVTQFVIADSGGVLVFLDPDGAWIWRGKTPTEIIALSAVIGSSTSARLLGFSDDGSTLLVHADDAFKRLSAETGREVARVSTVPLALTSADTSADGGVVIGSGMHGLDLLAGLAGGNLTLTRVTRWDLTGGHEVSFADAATSVPTGVLASSATGRLYVPWLGSGVVAWDLNAGRPLGVITAPGIVVGMALSPDGGRLAQVLNGGQVQVASTLDGAKPASIQLPPGSTSVKPGLALAFAPDGGTLAVAADRTVQLIGTGDSGLTASFSLPHGEAVMALAFAPDGAHLATAGPSGRIRVWQVATGQQTSEWEFTGGSGAVALSWPASDTLVLGDSNGALSEVDAATGRVREVVVDARQQTRVFAESPDRALVAVIASEGNNSLRVFERATGRARAEFDGEQAIFAAWVSPDALITARPDGSLRYWSVNRPERRVTLASSLDASDWFVATDEGLFDGTPNYYGRLQWRFGNDTFDVLPVEAFFADFYRPGLLGDVVAGRVTPAPDRIMASDRRQVGVSIAGPVSTAAKTVRLQIALTEAPADATHARASGVRDLRLFRNGNLVRRWDGDLVPRGQGATTVTVEVPVVAGSNRFTAYAFNANDIRSPDAEMTVVGAESLRRKGVFYVVAIGINDYGRPGLDLRYAVPDALAAAQGLRSAQDSVGIFERTEVISLLDRAATRANVLGVLGQLAGTGTVPASTAVAGTDRIQRLEPEDALVIYFAGHGVSQESRFYFLPSDLWRTEPAAGASLDALRAGAISDRDLAAVLEPLDGAHLALIVDACNSGALLGGLEQRLGPMNSAGLAQLAYEKGMYILAAAQGTQAALELRRLGHGLLTYALMEEGVARLAAAKHGTVDVRSWFDYAVTRVPALQHAEIEAARGQGRSLSFVDGDAPRGLGVGGPVFQQPRVFYRRDRGDRPLVLVRAEGWDQTGAEAGDPMAMRAFAERIERNQAPGRRPSEAMDWLIRAARTGDVESLMAAAVRTAEGRFTEPNGGGAAFLLMLAALKGSGLAARLAGDYAVTEPASKRLVARDVYYRIAAAGGDADAMTLLGSMYQRGEDLPRNDELARVWFARATAARGSDATSVPDSLIEATEHVSFTGFAPPLGLSPWLWRRPGDGTTWQLVDLDAPIEIADFLLDGPIQNGGKFDMAGASFVARVSEPVEFFLSERGRAYVHTRTAEGGVRIETVNLWQLDFATSTFVTERQLRIPCREDRACVFVYTVKDGNVKLAQSATALLFPVDDEALAADAREGLSSLAAQFRPAEPEILHSFRWRR